MPSIQDYAPISAALASAAGYSSDCVQIVRDGDGVAWALHARTRKRWVLAAS
jgi:hypothetical protein